MEKYPVTKAILRNEYEKKGHIGSGADGNVHLCQKKDEPSKYVVVKEPRPHPNPELCNEAKSNIENELWTMKEIRGCDNIVAFLGYDDDWWCEGFKDSRTTALFLEYCSLGGAGHHFHKLVKAGGYVPELTVWKFMWDMAKAFYHLHEELDDPVIHMDLKTNNVLVAPDTYPFKHGDIELLPKFKLCDFSRSTEYTRILGARTSYGTWPYVPPWEECRKGVTPAADIFALGAVIQSVVYYKLPIIKFSLLVRKLREEGYADIPSNPEKFTGRWKRRWPVIYRDLRRGHPTYKDAHKLNDLYSRCLEKDVKKRITAKELMDLAGAGFHQRLEELTNGSPDACIFKPDDTAPPASSATATEGPEREATSPLSLLDYAVDN